MLPRYTTILLIHTVEEVLWVPNVLLPNPNSIFLVSDGSLFWLLSGLIDVPAGKNEIAAPPAVFGFELWIAPEI